MFKKGDVVVFTEEHKKNVLATRGDWYGWYISDLDSTFIVKGTTGNFVIIDFYEEKDVTVWGGFLRLKNRGYHDLMDDVVLQLQQENEQLKQRLIEAERNALYWTAFDCPVNRDIAERILRKEN